MAHNARFQTDRRRILTVVLIANLVLAVGIAALLLTNWQRDGAGVQQIVQSQAAFWADSMNQRYDLLQTTCEVAGRRLRLDPLLPQSADAQSWIDDIQPNLSFVTDIALVSDKGVVLAATRRSAPHPQDITTTAGFQHALSTPGQLQIGLPQRDPHDSTRTITPARCALYDAKTRHWSVLVFSVALQTLLNNLQQTLPAHKGERRWVPAVGLLRSDGELLARLPAPPPRTQVDLARAPARAGELARQLAANPDQGNGTFVGTVRPAPDTESIGAWRRLSGHPVVAFVSLPASLLAGLWWRQTWPVLLAWGLLLLLQAIGGTLISRAVDRQRRLAQINAALAQANQIVAEATDEPGLLHAICRVATGSGGMKLAWIGRPDAFGRAQVLAADGTTGYLDGLDLSIHADQLTGQGPFGVAWRENRPVAVQRDKSDRLAVPWARRLDSFGLRTLVALPIHRRGRLHSVFSIYRGSRALFSSEQRGLLEELARSLGRGLDRLDLVAAERAERESRQRQQELVRSMLAQIDILISARSDTEVLESACTRLLETGLFAAVWVGRPDAQGTVQPLSAGGNGADVLAAQPALQVDVAQSHAFARAWHQIEETLDADAASPLLTPWADYALPGWTQLALALPLRRARTRWAVLVLVLLNRDDLDDALHPLLLRVAGLVERALAEIDLKAQLESERAQQRHLARHDALTGLPNRLSLEHHLPLAMARARRNKNLLAVGVMDLDDFKPVNDNLGHAAGDILLRQLGERLKAAVRETDLVARLGGDEFVLVLEGMVQADDLPIVLDRVHAAVETPFDLGDGAQAKVGMSLGMTLYPTDDAEAEVLLRHADAALYATKTRKADRSIWWQIWGDGLEQSAARAAELPAHVDPYGDTAARLLGLVADMLARNARAFIERFFDAIHRDPESAALLAALSSDEYSHLRAQQHEHVLRMLSPALSAEAHQEDARKAGSVHALVGVSTGSLVTNMGWYLQSLHDLVADAPLRRPDRIALAQVTTARLQRELQWQTEGAQGLREQYQQLLFGLEQMQSDLTQWADLARTVLQSVAALPGMAATVIYKPDAAGQFVPEFTAGVFDDYLLALDQNAVAPLQLDPNSPFGQTPHPRCWRSEQIETNISYMTDPRMTPWRSAAHSVGIRSSAALPIKDNRGRMLAVLGLYGRYPAMFDTQAMQTFMGALEQMFERAAYGLMVRREEALLPARDRRAWRHRLFSGGLEMHYQPIVDLHTGEPTVLEALARLRLEDGRLIGPGQFLPSFGASELTRLFILGLDQSLDQLLQWDAAGVYLGLSVNLPPEVLLMPDCARWVGMALKQHHVAPERLRLEILEDADFQNDSERDRAVHALALTGVKLVMDDLGSGYSSLLRLRTLPFHTVKIDQGLVREIPRETDAEAQNVIGFIGALVRMTQALGLRVVVEGLETPALVEVAAILGADSGQGYALAKPMQAIDVLGWVRQFTLSSVQPAAPQTALGRQALHWVLENAERGMAGWGKPDQPVHGRLH